MPGGRAALPAPRQGNYKAEYKLAPQWGPLLEARATAARAGNRTGRARRTAIDVIFPLIVNSTAERAAGAGTSAAARGSDSGGGGGAPAVHLPAAAAADWAGVAAARWGARVALRPHGRALLEATTDDALLPVRCLRPRGGRRDAAPACLAGLRTARLKCTPHAPCSPMHLTVHLALCHSHPCHLHGSIWKGVGRAHVPQEVLS